jgi:hypothetical protein
MSLLSDLWTRLKTAIEGDATTIEATLTATEQKYLPAFEAWCKKMESVLSGQGLTILEQGLTDIGTAFLAGANPGAAIAALVPQVVAQVKTDLNTDEATVEADARNAAYTAIGLTIAALPSPAPAETTAPVPTPA